MTDTPSLPSRIVTRRHLLAGAAAGILLPRSGRAAAAPRKGRHAGCTIVPRREGVPQGQLVFRANGAYTHPTRDEPVRVSNVDVTVEERTAAILGDGEGRLVASPDPEGAGLTRLCAVRVRPGARVAHHSFLTFEPPVDDPAAAARKAAYDAWPLPTRQNPPGPRLQALADAASLAAWDGKARLLRLKSSATLAGLALRPGSVTLGDGGTYRLENVSIDAPAVAGSEGIVGWPGVRPKALAVEFFELSCSAADPAHGYGGGGGVLCQNATLRHGTISDFQHGVAFPGNGVYEYLLIKDCGKQAGAHGNGFFCVYPEGTERIGDCVARYVNVDMPCPSSPDWVGNTMTACVSMFNTMAGKPTRGVRNMTFEHCRFNGGSRAVTLYSRNGEQKIADVTFTNCAFGRHFEYPGIGPVLLDGPLIENARFVDCFWEDSGELIAELNGVWDTTSGKPVRRPA